MTSPSGEPRQEVPQDLPTLERFIPHLVHALRNSLSSIKLSVQTVRDAKSPNAERMARSMALAAREIDRLERTLSLALELVQPSSAEARDSPAIAKLDELLTQAIDAVMPELKARNVELIRTGGPEAIPALRVNAGRMLLCMQCLLSGIARAIPEAGRLSVGLTASEGAIRLRIQDSGPAITEAEQSQLFRLLSRSVRSSGLDLPLAARVAQDLGGSIEAANLPTGGVAITLTLPIPSEPV